MEDNYVLKNRNNIPNPVDDAMDAIATTPDTRTEDEVLLEQLRLAREQDTKNIQEASDRENLANMISQLGHYGAQYASANVGADTGFDTRLKSQSAPIKYSGGAERAAKQGKSSRQELLDQYKLLQSNKSKQSKQKREDTQRKEDKEFKSTESKLDRDARALNKAASDKKTKREFTQEQKDYWVNEKGLSPTVVDMAATGMMGRNPVSTLNRLLEQDELTTKETGTVSAFNSSEQILKDIIDITSDEKTSSWIGRLDALQPKGTLETGEADFRAKVGRFNDAYRKAITGAGASTEELKRLETRLPEISDSFSEFREKAKGLVTELSGKRDIYLKDIQKSGKNIDKFLENKTQQLPNKDDVQAELKRRGLI